MTSNCHLNKLGSQFNMRNQGPNPEGFLLISMIGQNSCDYHTYEYRIFASIEIFQATIINIGFCLLNPWD